MLKFDPTMPSEWCSTCKTATPQALLDTGHYGCAKHSANPKTYGPATPIGPGSTVNEPVDPEIPAWML